MTVRRTIFALTLLLLVTTRQSSAMLPPLYPAPPIHGRMIMGMLSFQDPAKPATNGTPAVPAKAPATVDNEEQVIILREQLLQTRKDAAIQPQLIAFREQLLKQIDASREVVDETKAIAELRQKFDDRKVKEAGKDPKTHRWDRATSTAIEKPKPPSTPE